MIDMCFNLSCDGGEEEENLFLLYFHNNSNVYIYLNVEKLLIFMYIQISVVFSVE